MDSPYPQWKAFRGCTRNSAQCLIALYDPKPRTSNLSALQHPVLSSVDTPQAGPQSEPLRLLNRTLPFGGGTIPTLKKKFFGRVPPPSSFRS